MDQYKDATGWWPPVWWMWNKKDRYKGLLPDTQNYRLRMRRECRERFPRHRGLAIQTCITARAWRTCRDACRDRQLAVSLEVGDGENVPGIPGACTTRNFAYLVRGPLACEKQQRKLRSLMRTACGETSTMDTELTQAAAAAEPPRDGQPSVDVVTAHSETSPASRNEAAHSETPHIQSSDKHCLEHCRHGRSEDGDMIRCCMCFRWHHEQCVSDCSIRQLSAQISS